MKIFTQNKKILRWVFGKNSWYVVIGLVNALISIFSESLEKQSGMENTVKYLTHRKTYMVKCSFSKEAYYKQKICYFAMKSVFAILTLCLLSDNATVFTSFSQAVNMYKA